LPRRATEFLDGIVRAQIDRLTPWSAENAAFGWSPPAEISNERVLVTVAATARALVAPMVAAIARLGADSIAVLTVPPDAPDGAPIKVFDQRVRGALEVNRVRRVLAIVLLAAGVLAGTAIAADVIGGGEIDSRHNDGTSRTGAQPAQLRPGGHRPREYPPDTLD